MTKRFLAFDLETAKVLPETITFGTLTPDRQGVQSQAPIGREAIAQTRRKMITSRKL